MTDTPIKQIKAPIKSYRSGVFLSTHQPHRMASTMNTPPYAAYTRPNVGKFCSVGRIPYTIRIKLPKTPYHGVAFSLSHNHIRYPPPISAIPATINKSMAEAMISPHFNQTRGLNTSIPINGENLTLFISTPVAKMPRAHLICGRQMKNG
jgi:hypothetical protein